MRLWLVRSKGTNDSWIVRAADEFEARKHALSGPVQPIPGDETLGTSSPDFPSQGFAMDDLAANEIPATGSAALLAAFLDVAYAPGGDRRAAR